MLTARETQCIDVFGWQLEVGVEGYLLSTGYEFAAGKLADGSWGTRGGASGGTYGFGYVIRLTPS